MTLRKIASKIKNAIHIATKPNPGPPSPIYTEKNRLSELPRYVPSSSNITGFEMEFPDGLSFIEAWKEIWEREIYSFQAETTSPLILECGANVGLASLYFKKKYPNAKIIAFEPDPKIFGFLKKNVESSGFKGIDLNQKAVWYENTKLPFFSEGSDSGRILEGPESLCVESIDLSEYLTTKVDFLKIDIEGAEFEVLSKIERCLSNVERLFLEYHSYKNLPQVLDSLLGILKRNGFRYHMHSLLPMPKPFIEKIYHGGMDVIINIFADRLEIND
jgi:FkbM family methyltransferase